MDGFVRQARQGRYLACHNTDNPGCSLTPATPDVMGYHDWHEIPNYWAYARNFVLQDHMFEADNSWSLPSHLFLVSGWSARCSKHGDPLSCKSTLESRRSAATSRPGARSDYPLDRPDLPPAPLPRELALLRGERQPARLQRQHDVLPRACTRASKTPSIWNPLPRFDDVRAGPPDRRHPAARDFYRAAHKGTLAGGHLDRPEPGRSASTRPRSSRAGQTYVTRLIDAIMRGPDWKSTAIFLAWDDWGGFYDHVNPPVVDAQRLRPARARRS